MLSTHYDTRYQFYITNLHSRKIRTSCAVTQSYRDNITFTVTVTIPAESDLMNHNYMKLTVNYFSRV